MRKAMPDPSITLQGLNNADEERFLAVVAPLFEGAPAFVARAWAARPFATLEDLHDALTAAMQRASREEQITLIRAHPDLVGRAALAGTLGADSTHEQAAAGLDRLTPDEITNFTRLNAAYHDKFGFPFVICARENKKDAILAAFPVRLAHTDDEEVRAALREISK